MYLNFSEPSINHLRDRNWAAEKALIFENYGPDDWVYLIIEGIPLSERAKNKTFVPIVHPMHLHGHDFFLLAQQWQSFNLTHVNDSNIFHFNNPPRRDVALLPVGGYIAIAFKTDNPGIWILHCHIAWHASSGLALQIFERQPDVIKQSQQLGWADQTNKVCAKWRSWLDNPKNWFDSVAFQEDSGI
ncbi:MAG: hypothetical protein LQ342_008248 [Letrouitia transgressa]|nr:MAG: hypothetical protein LQ342_008248 [Letrouitia transgressa]